MARKRTRKPLDAPETGILTLDETINHLQANRIPLFYRDDNRVEVWTRKKQSMPFRRAIYAHNRELHNLVRAGDCRVCVNPELHRSSWQMDAHGCVCVLCQHLDRHIVTYGEALAAYYRRQDADLEALEVQAEQDLARLKENDVLQLPEPL